MGAAPTHAVIPTTHFFEHRCCCAGSGKPAALQANDITANLLAIVASNKPSLHYVNRQHNALFHPKPQAWKYPNCAQYKTLENSEQPCCMLNWLMEPVTSLWSCLILLSKILGIHWHLWGQSLETEKLKSKQSSSNFIRQTRNMSGGEMDIRVHAVQHKAVNKSFF